MKSLILLCGGKSTRFPNMRPKWLLTHPDGKLMVEKAIEKLNLEKFDRIIIPILKEHNTQYDVELILHQIFGNSIEVLLLDSTNSPSDTASQAIKLANIIGAFVVKDCDNSVVFDWPADADNFIVSLDIQNQAQLRNLPAKSFLVSNNQDIVIDIVEKRVVSNNICLGVYGFESAELFLTAFNVLKSYSIDIYISHIIAYLIGIRQAEFHVVAAKSFEDWGTAEDWRVVQQQYTTYVCDLDGVLFKNASKYGIYTWNDPATVLIENVNVLLQKSRNGAQIIFMSARSESLRERLTTDLQGLGFIGFQLVLGCNHAPRVLINDFAATNPYPSASAINLPRNGNLKEYL